MTVEAMVEKVARYLKEHPGYVEAMITKEDRYIMATRQDPNKSFFLPIDSLWDENDIVYGTVVFDEEEI